MERKPSFTFRTAKTTLFLIALFAGPSATRAQTGSNADVESAISNNLENDAVKADLAGDAAFYQRVLAEDWTRAIAMEPISPKPYSAESSIFSIEDV